MRQSMIAGNAATYFLLLVLSAIVLAPVMSRAVDSSDYKNHYRIAFDPSFLSHVNHPLFHETVRFYTSLLPAESRELTLLAATLTFMAPVPLPIFWWLRRVSRGQLPDYIPMLLSLGLVVVSPITLWTDSRYMVGYFNPVVYHNPTLNALRPFLVPMALLSLLVFAYRPDGVRNRRAILMAVSAVLVVLATLAKPSYTIALIPGLCVFAGYRHLRSGNVDWKLLVIGFCVPASVVLGGLYLASYGGAVDDSSIGLGFLTVMAHHVPMWRIPFQLVLSIAFPATVYLLYWTRARQNLFLNLSWLVFGIAAMISLCVIEVGPRWKAGNFLWTSYSAIFVLMFATLGFLIEQFTVERGSENVKNAVSRPRVSMRFCIAMLVFLLHVISGVAYYFRSMSEF